MLHQTFPHFVCEPCLKWDRLITFNAREHQRRRQWTLRPRVLTSHLNKRPTSIQTDRIWSLRQSVTAASQWRMCRSTAWWRQVLFTVRAQKWWKQQLWSCIYMCLGFKMHQHETAEHVQTLETSRVGNSPPAGPGNCLQKAAGLGLDPLQLCNNMEIRKNKNQLEH